MENVVRQRARHEPNEQQKHSEFSETVKKIDAFNKLPNECVNSTTGGGGASIIIFIVIFILATGEIRNFFDPAVDFSYSVDNDIEGNLPINVDLTIAMKCSDVSLDVIDAHGGIVDKNADLKTTNCKFEMDRKIRTKFEAKRNILSSLRDRHLSIYQMFWFSQSTGVEANPVQSLETWEEATPPEKADACRFTGTLIAKKSQGNMHVVVGQHMNLGENVHIHIAPWSDLAVTNLSHRFHHLSFGTPLPNYVHPLESEEIISDNEKRIYQYFIEVVPTTVTTWRRIINTYQYAVTEQTRIINHMNQSHGTPGIYLRYDVFPVRVHVTEAWDSVGHLLIRLSAICGGVFASANFFSSLLTHLLPTAFCLILTRSPVRPGMSAKHPLLPESDT